MATQQATTTVAKADFSLARSDQALGSIRLDGLELAPFLHEYVCRVDAGEMTLEQAIAGVKAYYQRQERQTPATAWG